MYVDTIAQLKRDLGVPHPRDLLRSALRRRSDAEVTPFAASVVDDRLQECGVYGVVILLMRGARIEAVAAITGETVDHLAERVRALVRNNLDPVPWWREAQSTLDLGWRV